MRQLRKHLDYQSVNAPARSLSTEPVRGIQPMKLIKTISVALTLASPLSLAAAAWAAEQNPMFACMETQQDLPPASRAAVCECYVEKSVAWSARLTQTISSRAVANASKRSILNECISDDYSKKNDPGKPS